MLFALSATAPRAKCSAVLLFCRTKTAGRSSHAAAPHASQRQARWASHLFAKVCCFALASTSLVPAILGHNEPLSTS